MIDLTPLEVRKKKGDFKKTLRGYDPALVDDFLDVVADRLDQLVRENIAMTERITRAEHQVSDNRERERALTDALVTAQEMREEVRQQTAREAELTRRTAEQEAMQIRADAMQAREREEEVLRRLRARQQQLLQSYRTFLAREMAELQVIGETLEIEGMSPMDAPRTGMRETPDSFSDRGASMMRPASSRSQKAEPPAAPQIDEQTGTAHQLSPVPLPAPRPGPVHVPLPPKADATERATSTAPEVLEMFDMPEPLPVPTPVRMLDTDIDTPDTIDHVTVMGALEIAILEDEEPFAPEPVDEWDSAIDSSRLDLTALDLAAHDAHDENAHHTAHEMPSHTEPEMEIGAPDHDAMILLENALKAGYKLDLDDDDDIGNTDDDELLLEDATDDDGEPPAGWLDKMIDDDAR